MKKEEKRSKGRPKREISLQELIELKRRQVSHSELVKIYGVSRSTIIRRLREVEPNDPQTLDFANRLVEIAALAPDLHTKKDVWKTVYRLRTKNLRKRRVIDLMRQGVTEPEEIAEALNFSYEEIEFFLDEIAQTGEFTG